MLLETKSKLDEHINTDRKEKKDHIEAHEKDKAELDAKFESQMSEMLAKLKDGSVGRQLVETMLEAVGLAAVAAGGEGEEDDSGEDTNALFEDAGEEDSSNTEMVAAVGFRYEDTKPAPTEDIETLMKEQELTGGTLGDLIDETTVSNLISAYAKDGSINRRLRKGQLWNSDKRFLLLAPLVLEAIPPSPFQNYFVYRCVKASPDHVLFFQQRVGKLMSDKAFTSSCAFSPQQQLERQELSNTFATMNTYIAIRSRSGRFVRKYVRSESFKNEWEVLFCHGTTFRVLSFEDTRPEEDHKVGTRGRYLVVVEEVKSRIPGLKKAQLNNE